MLQAMLLMNMDGVMRAEHIKVNCTDGGSFVQKSRIYIGRDMGVHMQDMWQRN